MTEKECLKCIHHPVCKTAESCDGFVSGCKHFKEQKKGRMGVKEKLVELLVEFVEVDAWDNGEFIEKDIDFGKIAENLIANGVTVQEWISVKDRLPNYFEHVLMNAPGDKPFTTVHEAHLRKDGLWDTGLYRYGKEDVTHWQPLPQPPKGE